jgi:AcrR family transcriptional regulator
VNTTTAILEAAAELLATSPVADVSTRAVCEAAGVGAPTLYRHFGDKEGLLKAVIDHGFEQYLAAKRAAKPSADPIQDLRDGWDGHVAFALSHPSHYRLMHSPAVRATPAAAIEGHRLLVAQLGRCAAAGRLRVSSETAAQLIMPANIGVALLLVTRPELYRPEFSAQVRDAIHAAILTPAGRPAAGPPPVRAVAAQLAAVLETSTSDSPLSPAETRLLSEWLRRLAA